MVFAANESEFKENSKTDIIEETNSQDTLIKDVSNPSSPTPKASAPQQRIPLNIKRVSNRIGNQTMR